MRDEAEGECGYKWAFNTIIKTSLDDILQMIPTLDDKALMRLKGAADMLLRQSGEVFRAAEYERALRKAARHD